MIKPSLFSFFKHIKFCQHGIAANHCFCILNLNEIKRFTYLFLAPNTSIYCLFRIFTNWRDEGWNAGGILKGHLADDFSLLNFSHRSYFCLFFFPGMFDKWWTLCMQREEPNVWSDLHLSWKFDECVKPISHGGEEKQHPLSRSISAPLEWKKNVAIEWQLMIHLAHSHIWKSVKFLIY